MINFLLELGISIQDVNNIIEFNNDITDYEDYKKNIEALKMIDCDESEIRNIIISNPNILLRSNDDLIKLINCFKKLGFTSLNILFDSNPFLLSKDDFELINFFNKKRKEGLMDDDIIDIVEFTTFDF